MSKYDKAVPSQYDGLMQQAADAHGVSYDYLRKLIFNESSFNPNAMSPTGPVGLGQFTKATARSLGLNVTGGDDDDRLNPEKSINAVAQHLKDLTGKFGGDELKAALAYNQGEGRDGAPQLAAYDSGDFSKISSEGLQYMQKLTDVARSDKLGALTHFGGITPGAEALNMGKYTDWGNKPGAVQSGVGLPDVNPLEISGQDVPESNKPFSQSFYEQTGRNVNDANPEDSTFFKTGAVFEKEAKTSIGGLAIRSDNFDVFKDVLTPTRWNSHQFTPEELKQIREEVDPDYYSVVLGGDSETLPQLIQMAKENKRLADEAAGAGMAANIVGGLGGAALDPLSYVPIAGNAFKGAKLISKMVNVGAQTAAMGVGSEFLRTHTAGGEAHFAEAAAMGFTFGAGLTGIADGISKGLAKNPWGGTVHRLEGRETARNLGIDDPAKMPITDTDELHSFGGVNYAHAIEDGAVRLEDGSILSAHNPLNPHTQRTFAEVDPNPEKAAFGVKLGGLTELGLMTLRSDSAEVRGVASDLFRSPTGMQSGSNGKFGATASDVTERLRSHDNRLNAIQQDTMRTILKDPEWSLGPAKTSELGARQEIYRRVSTAIEGQRHNTDLMDALTDSERVLAKNLQGRLDAKLEMAQNPAMFGEARAIPVLGEVRTQGHYIPRVISREAKALQLARVGGDPEILQDAVKRSFLASYLRKPGVKSDIDAYLKELADNGKPMDVETYANNQAYGYVRNEDFHVSAATDDNLQFGEGLVGIEKNNFLESRNLFDTDVRVTMPDGNDFAVDDIRDWNFDRILPAYDRRMNGDIAIHATTGKTTGELKDYVVELDKKAKMSNNGQLRNEVSALQEGMKILTGRARRAPDGVMSAMTRALTDMSFVAKNAYMGIQNVTEIAGMLVSGNVHSMAKGVPMIGEWMNRNKVLPQKELQNIHRFMFGKEIDDSIRPSRQDIIEALRDHSSANSSVVKAVGTLKYGTGEAAARSPFTKFLNGTSNYIIDVARQGVIGDIVDKAMKGKTSRWMKDNYLFSASVSKEQAKALVDHIKKHVVIDPATGRGSIPDMKGFTSGASSMDLWRIADKVADETILRPHKVSLSDSEAYGAGVKLALQFKSFTIKSLNSKFMRQTYEGMKNQRKLDTALTWMTSMGLAGGYYVMQAHMKAATLPKEQQSDYLKKALDPSIIGYAAVSRSSTVGSPLGIANFFLAPMGWDPAIAVRSSILPRGDQKQQVDKPIKGFALGSGPVSNFANGILQQIPGAGYAANLYGTAHNLAGYLNAPNTVTQRDYMTGMYMTSRELLPNDPLTQQLILKTYEHMGMQMKVNK